MGCGASIEARLTSTRMPGLSHLKTGDLVWFGDAAESGAGYTHVGVAVSLPTLFPHEPLLLFEFQRPQRADALIDKLTGAAGVEGPRLVNLPECLRLAASAGERNFFQTLLDANAEQPDRRLLGAENEALPEHDVMAALLACRAQNPLALAVALMQRLGVYAEPRRKRRRLPSMEQVAQGCLLLPADSRRWAVSLQLQEFAQQ